MPIYLIQVSNWTMLSLPEGFLLATTPLPSVHQQMMETAMERMLLEQLAVQNMVLPS